MKIIQSTLAISLLLAAATAHAQLYKWVGPDGKVTYSDSPPPSSIKKVETRSGGGPGETGGPALPFEVAEAARNNPVVLYSAPGCAPCDEGRKLLNTRGIPFSEKTVVTKEDIARFKQVGGEGTLPLLTIGRNKQNNFNASDWLSALTYAGYPETSKLPPGYRNAAAEPLAPPAATAAAPSRTSRTTQAEARPADDVPPATGNAPPGFRF